MDTVTKEEFLRYEQVRRGGQYNMIMDAREAMQAASLTKDKYFYIIKNYTALANRFLKD